MQRILASTLVLGTLAASGVAQDEPHNNMRGTASNWVSRFAGAGTYYVGRFDDMAVRGLPPTVGGRVDLHDFVAATPDTFDLVIFDETGPGTHLPKSPPTADVGPNPLKGGWNSVALSGPPIFVRKPNHDFWLGVRFTNARNSSDNDGGWAQVLLPSASSGNFDMPGRRLPASGLPPSNANYAGGSGPTPSSAGRTMYAEPLHKPGQGVGAYAVAKTNQANQLGIAGDKIIGGFNSGRNPDVTGHNTGRQDDFGFEVQGSLAVNKPVVFFVAAQYGPPIPLNVGVFCLDLNTLVVLGAVVGDTVGMATVMLPNALGQALVAAINNPDLYWGAVIVDTANNNQLIGTPCAQTRL